MLDKLENSKDKALGKIKETTGKLMDNEELEFRGKVQGMKATVEEKADDIKETLMGKANDLMDKAEMLGKEKKEKPDKSKW